MARLNMFIRITKFSKITRFVRLKRSITRTTKRTILKTKQSSKAIGLNSITFLLGIAAYAIFMVIVGFAQKMILLIGLWQTILIPTLVTIGSLAGHFKQIKYDLTLQSRLNSEPGTRPDCPFDDHYTTIFIARIIQWVSLAAAAAIIASITKGHF